MNDAREEAASARDLRRQIRQWRRGRADARLVDVIGDVYVAVFSTLVLGSMLISLLVQTGALTARSCSEGTCQSARFWAPWLIALVALTATGALARLFGPVFVSAATASWILATPVRRRSFLVGPFAMITAIVGGFSAAVVCGAAMLAGIRAGGVMAMTAGSMLAAVALVSMWALVQAAGSPRLLTAALLWVPALAVEVLLILAGRGDLPAWTTPRGVNALGAGVLTTLLALALVAVMMAGRGLGLVRNRDLAAGGRLGAALSGALATLDLALVYDVVVEQRCRRVGQVRSRRGRAEGIRALVGRDAARLRRNPTHLLIVLATVPVSYAAHSLGAANGTAVIAVLTGFLALLPMMIGLRVLTRTAGLARMLPFSASQSRTAMLIVPGCCALLYGIALIPASPYPVPIALAALAAAARWVTARPPNYGRPLVSTPAGGVPPNLYGSAFRGFDVALVTSLPILIPHNGSTISIVASAVVLMVLINRQPTT